MKYMIERLGDISGKTFHNTHAEAFAQLEKEYPELENTKGFHQIDKLVKQGKTKEIMETGDSITNFDWSPEGDYLATISDLGFQIDLYSGEGTFLKTLSKEDMYENLIFIR